MGGASCSPSLSGMENLKRIESVLNIVHELRRCSLNFYLRFKHRNPFTQGFVPGPKDPE